MSFLFNFELSMNEDIKDDSDLFYGEGWTFQEFWDSKPNMEEVSAKEFLQEARISDSSEDWKLAFIAYYSLGYKYGFIRNYCYWQWKNKIQRDLAQKFISKKP